MTSAGIVEVPANADFVIESYVDPPSLPPASDFGEASRYGVTSPRKPLRDEGPARKAGNPKLEIRNPNR